MSQASRLAIIGLSFIILGGSPAGQPGASLMPAAWGQNIGERTVSGTVLGEDSHPIVSATVFLKNEKTKSIRSYTTTVEGHFRFSQVDMSEDFELWAEKDGKKSATKTVSSWDDRKDFINDLKLK
jgi:Carboxypeptidase regulatory-like domain